MINQNNIKKAITTHIEFIDYVEKVIKTMRETYPGKYHQYRSIKDLKVTNTEITYLEEDYNGDEIDITFPTSHLYLSEEELIKAVKAEQKADKIKAQLLKEEKEIEQRKQDVFLFNRLKEKLNL